jgi:hypothetical protein
MPTGFYSKGKGRNRKVIPINASTGRRGRNMTVATKLTPTKKYTVKKAIKDNYGALTFDFDGRRYYNVDGDKFETDQYGHLEVDLNSFLISFAGVEETDSIDEAYSKVHKYLAEHETDAEDDY